MWNLREIKFPRIKLSALSVHFPSLEGDRVITRKDWLRLRYIYRSRYGLRITSKRIERKIKKFRTLKAAQNLLNYIYRHICKDTNRERVNFIKIIDVINPNLISVNKENNLEELDTIIFEGKQFKRVIVINYHVLRMYLFC